MIVRIFDAPTEGLLMGHQCYDLYLLWFPIIETRLVVGEDEFRIIFSEGVESIRIVTTSSRRTQSIIQSIRIVTTSSRRTQSIIQEARSGRMMTDGLYI